MPVNRFVGDMAQRYDRVHADSFRGEALDPAVALLADLAAGGRAVEFAIGTGRVALPLVAAGVDVAGIELSTDMVAELRAKPGGADLAVTVGDMAAARVDGEFTLAYLVYNTIMNLTTQDEQVACFANAARHLVTGGRFVIECLVPTPPAPDADIPGQVFGLDENYVGIDEYTDTTHRQLQRSRHMHRSGDGTFAEVVVPFRYAWPAEMDLMARLAGMTLEDRWADWRRTPFTGSSPSHVSVWRRT